MKKILLFARDPGGANTIIPLVEPLKQKGYQAVVFGKDMALKKYKEAGIFGRDINRQIQKVSLTEIERFIKNEKPDLIITGTSADDVTEKYLWKASGKLGVPSFAILDQWVNYGIRFSSFGVSEIEKYNLDKKHGYLPTKILVMDEFAKHEAADEGLPIEKILVTGQPHFEAIRQARLIQADLDRLKTRLNIEKSDFVVTYASEPIIKTYSDPKSYWGFSEISIFQSLYEALCKASIKINRQIHLIVKLHPKEDSLYYSKILNQLPKEAKIKITVNQEAVPLELISISDMVCGIGSMFLLESAVLQKPTISIMIGLKRENTFILDKIGLIKSIVDQAKLNDEIELYLHGGKKTSADFELIENPIERTINEAEKLLCQN